MSGPNEFHLSFDHKDTTYDIHLIIAEKSDHSVKINGVTYAVLGSKEKLQMACEILNSVPINAISSSKDLQNRLSSLKDVSFPLSSKIVEVSKKPLKISDVSEKKSYINTLEEELSEFLPNGAGAMVGILEGGKEPLFINLGATLVDSSIPPNKNTVALIGSGAKIFTALLSKILEEKSIIVLEEKNGLMPSKLSDFIKDEHFQIFADPEAAKNITLESLLSHTSGLQYNADDCNNSRDGQSLDIILDSIVKNVKKDPSRAIKFTNIPGDKIYSYSNQIGLVAVCIEKAYKKLLVAELLEKKQLNKNQSLKELSPQLETFRNQLKEKILKIEEEIKSMEQLGAFEDVTVPYKDKLIILNADLQKLTIPDDAQDLTLKDLTGSANSFYTYDLINLFLMPSNNHQLDYSAIMKRELLQPLDMENTSFERPKNSNVLEACVIKKDSAPKTIKENILDPMMRGAGGLWSSPNDIMKLAGSFSMDDGFLDKDKKPLISKKGVAELTQVRGINGKTALAFDIEGSVIGKGGGISTYDFKFKLDTTNGNAMVSMCNFKGDEKAMDGFVTKAIHSLQDLNPKLQSNQSFETSVKIDSMHLENELNLLKMENCDEFFVGKQGYAGIKHTDFGIIINWNGVKLPAIGEGDHFVIFGGGPHDGKEVLLKFGKTHNTPYLFIEKGIESPGFSQISTIPIYELNFPNDVVGIAGIYKSPHPDGPKPISITTKDELLFAFGDNDPIAGLVTNVLKDNDEISEIWVMTTAEEVPDKIYKLIKNENDWSLGIAFFENPEINLEDPLPRS